MPETRLKKRILHRPDDLLELVADVERYPRFIDLISALRIKNQKEVDGVEVFEAEATVSYKFISEKFISRVSVDRANRIITVKKSERGGALKTLENKWVFNELSDGSTMVDFFVEVTLKAFPLNMLLKDKFEKIGKEIMAVFEHKAGLAYEKVGDPELVFDTVS